MNQGIWRNLWTMNRSTVVLDDTIWPHWYRVSMPLQGIQVPHQPVDRALQYLFFGISIHVQSWEGWTIRMKLVAISLNDDDDFNLHLPSQPPQSYHTLPVIILSASRFVKSLRRISALSYIIPIPLVR